VTTVRPATNALVALVALVAMACSGPTATTPAAQMPTQAMGADEIAKSDRFWAAMAFVGPTNFMYDSLADMTADADLVILGRVVGIRVAGPLPARDPGGEHARIQRVGVVVLDAVLKGRPIMGDAGKVLVAGLVSSDRTEADLPREQFVIFLKNCGQLKLDAGRGLFNDDSDRLYYARPNGYQAVLRDINGAVRITESSEGWLVEPDAVPAPLAGQRFDAILKLIRQPAVGEP
jgi:hypothetical protein